MKRVFIIGALIFLLSPHSAVASSLKEARQLYINGSYDAAITLAEDLNTAESLILAAETMSAKVMLGMVENNHKSAIQARRWAEKAIELAPSSQEARIQYALAYGIETRTSSPFRAWRKKLPEKTHAVIQDIRQSYPNDPRGDALLAAWHLGIIRKAGHKNGKKWYGATEDAGIQWYETAMQAAPNDIVLAGNYALTLLALDVDRYHKRASEIVAQISQTPPKNAVEIEIKDRITALRKNFDNKDYLVMAAEQFLDG